MTHLERTAASPTKRPLAPDTARLDARSVRAWTEPMAVEPLGSGRYAVESASGNEYVVDLRDSTCTCPDNGYRGARCKHLRRVAVEITRGELPPPGQLPGDCAACGRERFLPETGPALCSACRFEPGDVVRDRETGDLLVVIRVTDERADEWEIPEAGHTVAAHETNAGYPEEDPVVQAVYPFSGTRSASLTARPRYAFPHSRLEAANAQLIE